MYSVRWLLLFNLMMSVYCEYEEIGCFPSDGLIQNSALGQYQGSPGDLVGCIVLCSYSPQFDVALYSNSACYCSSTFQPDEFADIEASDCTYSPQIYNVAVNFAQGCSITNCDSCTPHRCMTCDSTTELNDQNQCELKYHEIGCYIKNQLTDTETGQIESFASDLDECMSICASLPQFDVALYKEGECYCSSHFMPPEHADKKVEDCTPTRHIFNVGANLAQDCSHIEQCGTCTQLQKCVTCSSGSEFNDLNECEAAGDACTSSPCRDVCTLDASIPDGFICSCSDNSQYLDENNDCQVSCSVTPRPIQHYPDLYRGSIIFVDFPFQCSGSVTAVEFYAEHAGTFYFSAWRPSASGDSWTLLGYNAIVSEGEGAQTYTIPSDEQMVVSSSDVFGFVYEKGVRYKIISSENISKRRRNGTSSRFVRTRETLDDLSIGVNRSNLAGDGNTERIVPINAIIS